MQDLALNIGGTPIVGPSSVPTGGLPTAVQIISNGIFLIIAVAVIITLFVIISAGIQWMTSGGDKAGLDTARKRLIFAIIGLVIIFLSFLIIRVIGFLFGGVPLLDIPTS